MPDLRRSNVVPYVLAGLVVVVAGGRWVRSADRPGGRAEAPAPARSDPAVRIDRAPGGEAVVHVAGEVRSPGVYRLGAGTRVEEAMRRAGGPTRRADLDEIYLGAEGEDGRQVIVPRRAAAVAGGTAPGPAPAGS